VEDDESSADADLDVSDQQDRIDTTVARARRILFGGLEFSGHSLGGNTLASERYDVWQVLQMKHGSDWSLVIDCDKMHSTSDMTMAVRLLLLLKLRVVR
jgi:hypothetical protein